MRTRLEGTGGAVVGTGGALLGLVEGGLLRVGSDLLLNLVTESLAAVKEVSHGGEVQQREGDAYPKSDMLIDGLGLVKLAEVECL